MTIFEMNVTCGDFWIDYGMNFPAFVLSGSSSFFVALIVLLRLLQVKNPMSYETAHKN